MPQVRNFKRNKSGITISKSEHAQIEEYEDDVDTSSE